MDRRTQIESLISDRMKKLALMVTPGLIVVDVGCDHGFISAYLVLEEIAPKVIAADVAEGPLDSARKTISQFGLSDKIETRLSDGFSAISKGESECALIAGMGGHLIMDIIEAGLEKLPAGYELILSPQSDVPEVRRFLFEKGIDILDEDMLIEKGKYYNIMKCRVGECISKSNATDLEDNDTDTLDDTSPEMFFMFGKRLLEKSSPVLKQYLLNEIEKKQKIYCRLSSQSGDNVIDRMHEIDSELKLMVKAYEMMEK